MDIQGPGLFDQPEKEPKKNITQRESIGWGSEEDRKSKKEQKARLLQELESQEWVSTHQLVYTVGHRFSTCVQSLRDQGYIIEKRPTDKRSFEYRYAGREEVEKTPADFQQRYMASRHWKKCREARLAFDGYACCICKKLRPSVVLDVHHWRYDLFQERLRDLMTLCTNCHALIHDNDKIHIKFPAYIPVSWQQKLEGE